MTPALVVPVLGRKLYPGASVALDFTRNLYRSGTPVVKGSPSLLSGWTFTRASTGYAETAAGALVAFASGAPRVTTKGILVEEARTNLLLRSQDFSLAWSLLRLTASTDAIAAPDGTVTADQLLDTAVAGTHVAIQTITKAASNIDYAASVYLKANVRTKGELRVSDQAGNGVRIAFDLSAGTITTPATAFGAGFTAGSSSITALADGWYRLELSATSNTATTLGHEVYVADATGATSYTGNGSGFYAWGAQLEAGAFPTSYIPTTTASATRAADVAYVSGIATPPAGFTLAVEFSPIAISAAVQVMAQFDDGTQANRSLIYLPASSSVTYLSNTASVAQANNPTGGTASAASAFKAALRVSANDFQAAGNGTLGIADAAGTLPTAPTILRFGVNSAGATLANSYIRRAILYPTAFNDAALQAATA